MLYPIISKGYVSAQSISSGNVTWKEIVFAYNLLGFENWLKDYYKNKNKQKEDVEYFD